MEWLSRRDVSPQHLLLFFSTNVLQYENQHELPRLPIPTVEETIGRFLPSALPLAKTEQEKVALQDACRAFPEQAKILQERLLARRDGEMKDSSWLQLWWNQVRKRRFVLWFIDGIFKVINPHVLAAWISSSSRSSCGQCVVFLSICRRPNR